MIVSRLYLDFRNKSSSKMNRNPLIPSLSDARNSPRVGFFVFVVERFEALVLLELAELGWIGEAEEGGRELHQPFGVDRCHFSHVFLGGLDELVVNDPGKSRKLSES
jgi:hypothetical protein